MATYKEFLYDWMGANEWAFREINSIHGPTYDRAMEAITRLGDYHNFPYYIIVLLSYVILSVIVRKLADKGGTKQYLITWFGIFVMLIAGFVAHAFLVQMLKNYFDYPRPFAIFNDITVVNRWSMDDATHGFPSGHMAFITMIFVVLWPALSANMRWLGFLVVLAVGWSRIALGAHFPADVIGGLLIISVMVLILRWVIYTLLFKLFRLKC